MRCLSCDHDNRRGAKFCDECGASVSVPAATQPATLPEAQGRARAGSPEHVHPEQPTAESCAVAARAMMRRVSAYWSCALTEVVGAVMILWHGVPIYRALLEGATRRMSARALLWAALGTILIQGAYVIRWQLVPIPRFRSHMIVGHVVVFLARLNFVFVSSMFSVSVFIRLHQLQFSLWRTVLLFVVLFAMFCFSLELDHLGRALSGKPAEHDIV